MTDDRAVASTLSYTLTLSITTILLVGLFAGAGSLVETQHGRAVGTELTVQGERLAADLMTVDRLSRTEDAERVEVRTDLPTHVGGEGYRIEITGDEEGNDTVELISGDIELSVDFTVKRTLKAERLNGGTIVIAFDDETGAIEVRDD